jgi:hypothetical protein
LLLFCTQDDWKLVWNIMITIAAVLLQAPFPPLPLPTRTQREEKRGRQVREEGRRETHSLLFSLHPLHQGWSCAAGFALNRIFTGKLSPDLACDSAGRPPAAPPLLPRVPGHPAFPRDSRSIPPIRRQPISPVRQSTPTPRAGRPIPP